MDFVVFSRFFFFLGNPKKHMCFCWVLVPGLKNRNHMVVFGFSFKIQKALVFFWIFNPLESHIKENTWFVFHFSEKAEKTTKSKKGGLPAPWF